MNRVEAALTRLRNVRHQLMIDIIQAVEEDEHLAEHPEIKPYDDTLHDLSDKLWAVNRIICGVEEAWNDMQTRYEKPPSNPWVHSETT